jgi:hypothetical protein
LDDAREQFFNGQHSLYITRHEDRVTTNALDTIQNLASQLKAVQRQMEILQATSGRK